MPQYLSTIINLLPVVIPAIVGLVLGIVFRSRARKASLLVILASVVLLLQAVFQVVTNHFLVPLSGNGLLSWEAYSMIVSAGYFVFGATTLGLLLAAAFVAALCDPWQRQRLAHGPVNHRRQLQLRALVHDGAQRGSAARECQARRDNLAQFAVRVAGRKSVWERLPHDDGAAVGVWAN